MYRPPRFRVTNAYMIEVFKIIFFVSKHSFYQIRDRVTTTERYDRNALPLIVNGYRQFVSLCIFHNR